MAQDVQMMDGGEDKVVGVEQKKLGKRKQAASEEELSEGEEGEVGLPMNTAQVKLRKACRAVSEGYQQFL